MSVSQSDVERLRRAVLVSLHDHWRFYLIEGIILIVLGAAAIIVPPIATIAATILFGWLFLISGIVGLFTTMSMRGVPGFWWSLFSAILAIVGGDVDRLADTRRDFPDLAPHRLLHHRGRVVRDVCP